MELENKVNEYIERLRGAEKHLQYLQNTRNLSEATVNKFRLGLDEYNNITIPIIENGKVVGIKKRTNPFIENPDRKYINPLGLSNHIFNIDRLENFNENTKQILVICEGEFDVMALEQYNFPAITQTTGAGFPVELIKEYLSKYKNIGIAIAFDNDKVGIERTIKIAKEFLDTKRVQFCTPIEHKDWNELIADIKNRGKEAEEINRQFKELRMGYEFIKSRNRDVLKECLILETAKLSDFEDEKAEYLVDPFIVKNGINLITGAPGSLKSMLTIYMIVVCMRGIKFLENFETKEIKKALLIDMENLKGEIKKRLKMFGGDSDSILLPKESFFFDKTENAIPKLKNLIKFEQIDLVVIDTMRRTNLEMDENSSKEVNNFFSKIIELKDLATIIILHHENKAKNFDGGSSYRGSGDIEGAIDSYISIKKEKKSGVVNLTITHKKLRYGNEFDPIYVAFRDYGEEYVFDYQGKVDQKDAQDLNEVYEEQSEFLLDVIGEQKENGMCTQEIEELCKQEFDIGQSKTRKLRERMINEGKIIRIDNFKGTKATHFLLKEYSAQQLNTYIE